MNLNSVTGVMNGLESEQKMQLQQVTEPHFVAENVQEEEDMCSYRKQENTNVRKIVLNAKNAENMYWTIISTLKKAYAVDV